MPARDYAEEARDLQAGRREVIAERI